MYDTRAETFRILLTHKLCIQLMLQDENTDIIQRLANFLVHAFRALETQSFKVATYSCMHPLDFPSEPYLCTRFLRIVLSAIYPSLGGEGLKVRTDKVASSSSAFGQYYLHTFYWNYLDYGDSSNARLTVRVDYDRDIYSGSNNNKKFYTFTFQASQAWREDREADRRFVKEKLALTMAMAKHQRLGASSTCHLKLIPDDVMRKIVFLCLQ